MNSMMIFPVRCVNLYQRVYPGGYNPIIKHGSHRLSQSDGPLFTSQLATDYHLHWHQVAPYGCKLVKKTEAKHIVSHNSQLCYLIMLKQLSYQNLAPP